MEDVFAVKEKLLTVAFSMLLSLMGHVVSDRHV